MSIKDYIELTKSDKDLMQSIELFNTKVLIDGHLIQRLLYQQSSRSQRDYKFSTDYTRFAETARRFLRRLRVCRIEPIIVFDGTVNSERYRNGFVQRIREIREICRNEYECGYQSPTLCNYVFTSVMRELGVDIIQTCAQTWPQMVELANKFMCPVFTKRPQVCFMDVEFGILADDSFDERNRMHYNFADKYWFYSCDVFHIKSLYKKYNGLRPEVMPLVAVITNNRFLDQNGFNRLSEDLKGWHKDYKLDILFNWLKGKNLKQSLDSIKNYLKQSHETNDSNIKQLLKEYEPIGSHSILRKYFNRADSEGESLKMLAKGDVEVVLPNWFVNEYQSGVIRPALMNIVKLKTHILYPQMEDFSQMSSFDCTLSLREFLYGILRTEPNGLTKISVFDRKYLERSETDVKPMLRFSDSQEIPFLGSVRNLSLSERRALFLSILGVNEMFINRCKISLMVWENSEQMDSIDGTTLLIIVMRYWIKHTNRVHRKDWKPFVGAMVLSIIYYSCEELMDDDNWTQLCDCSFNEKFDPSLVHQYSQFQAILHITNFINSILEFPLKEGKPYYCLNGIFLYNAMKKLSIPEEYDSLLNDLFDEMSLPVNTYEEFIQLIAFDLNVNL